MTGLHSNLTMAPPDTAAEFSNLLQQHRKIVFKIAATYAWTEADRADLAQEIATQLWRGFPSYDRSRPFTTWMYRVALNTGMAHARAESIKRLHFEEQADSAMDQVRGGETAEEIHSLILLSQVMELLGREERALLLLHLESRSTVEIADILGLSATNVTTRISRIRQRLSAQLA